MEALFVPPVLLSLRRCTWSSWRPSLHSLSSLPQSSLRSNVLGCAHVFSISRTRTFAAQNGTPVPSPIEAVPVDVARELLNKGHHYLDVRTTEEFTAGHIKGAVNIPFMNRAGIGMVKNGTFVEEVKKKFDTSDEIIVGCQAGKRSKMATSELAAAGFTRLTDMPGGFAAWVASGQPTTK